MIDLQVRLRQLREKAQALHPAPSAGSSLGERLERLRVAPPRVCARPRKHSPRRLQGELVAPGLIELVRTYPLPLRHGDITVASGRVLGEAAKVAGQAHGAGRSRGPALPGYRDDRIGRAEPER